MPDEPGRWQADNITRGHDTEVGVSRIAGGRVRERRVVAVVLGGDPDYDEKLVAASLQLRARAGLLNSQARLNREPETR